MQPHSINILLTLHCSWLVSLLQLHFNLVGLQRALVLADYAPALGVGRGGGLLVVKRVQEVWEKKRKTASYMLGSSNLTRFNKV